MKRLLLPLLLLTLPAPAAAEPGRLCRGAIQAAERASGIPAHLLSAIGRVESGRRDPETGAFHPWPWTINAEGRGQFFTTKAAAIAEVQALQARGVRSIDVGCMQVNLRHHPNAFANLDEAFDPTANANYAARFLTELQAARGGDWQRAAAAYHSQTPEFAEPYRARVLAAWATEQGNPHPPVTPPATTAATIAQPGGGGGFLSNNADRAATIANAGNPGRGLDAYRGTPVPIASRTPARLALIRR
ncbi:transglycosylase SLT domain-containing protein [Falsiroseomonas sp.]|uniref:transglycosylase SLT domain-containing protein n=1 Tax=Falsiroseomonas sp. TaxID=2870721 RepID=UPI003F6EA203